eukprot:TRINITY_DN4704_c0_g1_i1.p2 TRINITY_DN4704_c0_g1~~TRINITY_DN4704_c0_g1_i1.p2  ORF type:complete len:296 (+),score=61.59 TRINITY_DN4704_c0_g1_i1:101-889(+)
MKIEREADKARKAQILARIHENSTERNTTNQANHQQTAADPQHLKKLPSKSATTRINIRLPDGKRIIHTFYNTAKLRAVQETVIQECGLSSETFLLMTTFPKREFDQNEIQQLSLVDADLVPSGSVVVIMRQQKGKVKVVGQEDMFRVDPNEAIPDEREMSYEDWLELEEKIGKVKVGASKEELSSLKHESYEKTSNDQTENESDSDGDLCLICQMEYETGEEITNLPCRHYYHSKCIKLWLEQKKVCPMCNHRLDAIDTNN